MFNREQILSSSRLRISDENTPAWGFGRSNPPATPFKPSPGAGMGPGDPDAWTPEFQTLCIKYFSLLIFKNYKYLYNKAANEFRKAP